MSMAEDVKDHHRRNTIGMALAVVMTIAILAVVFWQSRGQNDFPDSSDSDNGGPDGRGMVDIAHQPAGFDEIGPGFWRVYAGPLVVQIAGMPATEFNFRMRSFNLMDDDMRSLVRAQRVLLGDPQAVVAAGVSEAQLEKLRNIQSPRAVVADADREQVIAQWRNWEKADASQKAAAQQPVVDAMRAAAEHSIEPTKKSWTDAATEVKSTLTLPQMAKLAVYAEDHPMPGMLGQGWGWAGRGEGWGGGAATQPR